MTRPVPQRVERLLRELAPQALGVLVRRHGQFTACEDAVQEALLAAAKQWPTDGVPENPRGWLITVATRRLIDEIRSEQSRRTREDATVELAERYEPPADEPRGTAHDDTLTLLFLCCHPVLTPASQIALTLRAVAGLSTAEIANAFLVPEATMAQRISRSKQTISAHGAHFAPPPQTEMQERMRAVRHVLYLAFNEGYTATAGDELQRIDLAEEAIRLTRTLNRLRPADGESTGLLALMLLTHARSAARVDAHGAIVPLADQDRSLWNARAISEGRSLIEQALANTGVGPYQLQAAIAAVHCEAASADQTDWRQILALHTLLHRISPNPMISLSRAIAVAMVHGPQAGLTQLSLISQDPRLAEHYRLHAVRAHMLELAGEDASAAAAYRAAARLTTSLPERRYLQARASALQHATGAPADPAR
ncbi:MAG TPA: sigma-70 family RNA polymerase sigma factor [Solirubrobacteraceae bacterium]|nr:sigma-70 family RNA polymerase sigma factor [Solirubrobacteraceae bacterium]